MAFRLKFWLSRNDDSPATEAAHKIVTRTSSQK